MLQHYWQLIKISKTNKKNDVSQKEKVVLFQHQSLFALNIGSKWVCEVILVNLNAEGENEKIQHSILINFALVANQGLNQMKIYIEEGF